MNPGERRLRRYAIYAVLHAVVLIGVIAAPVPTWTVSIALLAAVPFLFAWGHFHVDLIRNGELDEAARSRWRSLLWLLPWSMALYWFRYVRPRNERSF